MSCKNILEELLEEVTRHRKKEGVKAMVLDMVEESVARGEINILIKNIKDQRQVKRNEIEIRRRYQRIEEECADNDSRG